MRTWFIIGCTSIMVAGCCTGDRCDPSLVAVPPTDEEGPPQEFVQAEGLGDAIDGLVEELMDEVGYPGMQVAATHEGRLVYSGAYGLADRDVGTTMQPYTRIHVGSTTKVVISAVYMRQTEISNASVESLVYGDLLTVPPFSNDPTFTGAYTQGVRRYHPMIDVGIGSLGEVITWYRDGTYTRGTSGDLDFYQSPLPYELPAFRSPLDVVAIAQCDEDVYSWYRDGSLGVGTIEDLTAVSFTSGVNEPAYDSRNSDWIVGIVCDPNTEIFYAFYHDGRVTSGPTADRLRDGWDGEARDFVVPGSEDRRYDITGIARSPNGINTAYYSDETASKGLTNNLGSINATLDYQRPDMPGSRRQWIDAYEAIEMRHLLTHTSGLTGSGTPAQAAIKYGYDDFDADFAPVPGTITNQWVLSTRPLLFTPGSATSYSNHGMGLVGTIVGEMTGQDWSERLVELFAPADAGGVSFNGLELIQAIDAKGNRFDSDGELVQVPWTPTNHAGSSAGSMRLSAVDFAKILAAMDGYPNRVDVISGASRVTMERPMFESFRNRGLGWQLACVNDECSAYRASHNGLRVESATSAQIARYVAYPRTGDLPEIDGVDVVITTTLNTTDGLLELANAIGDAVMAHPTEVDLFGDVVSYIDPVE
ncbi:MAG: serine hydrolase domain-containing protein [Myxococcota bacterium]